MTWQRPPGLIAQLVAPAALAGSIITAAAAWWPIATSQQPSLGALLTFAYILAPTALVARWSLRTIQAAHAHAVRHWTHVRRLATDLD